MNEASDSDIDQSMDAFEAALSATEIKLPRITLDRILVALDGSNQDAAAEALARGLARKAEVSITREAASAEKPFEKILALAEANRCGLIVAPAPFREDFAELGDASIGTNLDMLLSRRATPLLVARDPERGGEGVLQEIVILLSFLSAEDVHAAAWGFRAVAPRGRLHLLAIANNVPAERAQKLGEKFMDVQDLDEAALAGLGQPEMAGLVASVQRRAAEENVGCRVSVRVGSPVEAVSKFCDGLEALLITSCPRDARSEEFQRAHALIRTSPNPVLVV